MTDVINASTLREQPIEQFSSIACVQCRRGHRKCDKKLPCCSNCKRLGKECSYRSPKKRGPQPKKGENENPLALPEINSSEERKRKLSESTTSNDDAVSVAISSIANHNNHHHEHYDDDIVTPGSTGTGMNKSNSDDSRSVAAVSTINQSSMRLSEEYVKGLCLEVYRDIIGSVLPLHQKQKMDKLMNQSLSNTNIISGTVKKKKMMNDIETPDLALLYALQSVCFQRIGQHDLSKQLYQRSRQTVSTVFDNITNFNVVCSYAYLSSYLVGEGDFLGAKFYLNSVLFFLEQQKHQTSESDSTFLKSLTTIIHLSMEEDKAQVCFLLNRLLSFIIACHPEFNLETPESGFLVCEEELTEKLRKLDLLQHSINATCSDNICSSKKDITKLVYLLYMDTMRIKILEKHGMKDSLQIREAADRITSLTRIPTFELVPVIIVRSVSMAARVHYNLLVKDVSNYNDDQLIRNLSDDLKALKLLGTKYEVVKTRFQQLIRDIELVLEQAEIQKIQRGITMENNNVGNLDNEFLSMINGTSAFYSPYFSLPMNQMNQYGQMMPLNMQQMPFGQMMTNPVVGMQQTQQSQQTPQQGNFYPTPLFSTLTDDPFLTSFSDVPNVSVGPMASHFTPVNTNNVNNYTTNNSNNNVDPFFESLNSLFQ
ncbi:hypothetical protein ABK040_001484 [Willaertia magna]